MRTLAFINLKGGVGKTVSAANVAHILTTVHHKKVLLEKGVMAAAAVFTDIFSNGRRQASLKRYRYWAWRNTMN